MNTNDQPDEQGDDSAGPNENFAASIEGLLNPARVSPAVADHNRRAAAKQGPKPAPATQRFTEEILSIFNQFERDRRAEIVAAGGDPDEDRDPLEYAEWIASEWAATAEEPNERAALLLRLADELTLEDLRTLRLAAEAAAAVTPRMVVDAAGRGMKPNQIADESGLTPSRIYSLLREARQEARAIEDAERASAEDLNRFAPPEEP